MFNRSANAPHFRDLLFDAQRDYSDGNLEAAARQAAKILAKHPSHAPANQMMARIELTRGNRVAAIQYLRNSLNGSVNRDEVAKWIQTLETLDTQQ